MRSLFTFAVVAGATAAFGFTTNGTKWGLGPNFGTALAGNEGTAGSANWSFMGAGLSIIAPGDTHASNSTSNFGALLGTAAITEEAAMFNTVFNSWASISGLINLGQVADGNVAGGATQASGGHLGDIRLGLIGGMGGQFGTLAHAFNPGTEALFGANGTIGGDMHFDIAEVWADDATDTTADADIDLYTVMLHELGHALGLGHSTVSGSVMEATYAGARRTLAADDIAGIQFIYGAEPVPEPATMAGLGVGIAWFVRRRRLNRKV